MTSTIESISLLEFIPIMNWMFSSIHTFLIRSSNAMASKRVQAINVELSEHRWTVTKSSLSH